MRAGRPKKNQDHKHSAILKVGICGSPMRFYMYIPSPTKSFFICGIFILNIIRGRRWRRVFGLRGTGTLIHSDY